MNDDQLLALLAEADPYGPDVDLPAALSSDSVRLTIERRADMDILELTKPQITPPKRRWRGVAIAAATFVVVVAVGAIIALATLTDDAAPVAPTSAPVVTTAAPPTTAAPVEDATAPSPEDLTVVSAMLEAHASGDLEALADVVSPRALLLRGPIHADNEQYDIDKLMLNARVAAAIGRTIEIVECEVDGDLRCDVTITDDFSNGLGLAPAAAVMRFAVAENQIVTWRVVSDDIYDFDRLVALVQFESWHQSAYPDDPAFYSTQGAQDHYYWIDDVADTIELAPIRIAEYLESLEG